MMNNWIFPVEILKVILEDLISEFRDIDPYGLQVKCAPYLQHNLMPLLFVCKSWHMISEKLLYSCVSVGGGVPLGLGQPNACIPETVPNYTVTSDFRYVPFRAHEIAERLMATLSANSRIAAQIKDLRLAIHDTGLPMSPEWTRANAAILHACPNVRHVQIIGFHSSESNTLHDVLKEKSLISFCITPHSYRVKRRRLRYSFNLLELIRRWPRLRIIKADGLHSLEWQNELNTSDAPRASDCCPDLQEIQITDIILHSSVLESLRNVSGNVKDLIIYTRSWFDNKARLEALCKCLRAWSPTLERLSLCTAHAVVPSPQLEESLSSLQKLRELEIDGSSDLGGIVDLPMLEQLSFSQDWGDSHPSMIGLITHLNNLQKFPTLKSIVVIDKYDDQLQDICLQRNIMLRTKGDDDDHFKDFTSW